MSRRPDSVNTLYQVFTPREVPLRFWNDGFYRLAADVRCARCKHGFVQILRIERWRSPGGLMLPRAKHRDPHDEQVMASFMAAACKNGVGNPSKHSRECPVGKMPKGKWLIADMRT